MYFKPIIGTKEHFLSCKKIKIIFAHLGISYEEYIKSCDDFVGWKECEFLSSPKYSGKLKNTPCFRKKIQKFISGGKLKQSDGSKQQEIVYLKWMRDTLIKHYENLSESLTINDSNIILKPKGAIYGHDYELDDDSEYSRLFDFV